MAGTDRTRAKAPAPSPAIILCEPQLGENIGMVARAMANFGLWDLRLVNPRDGWPNDKATAAAASAVHVVEGARVFETVEAAIADLNLVLATTARSRDMFKPVIGPDEAASRCHGAITEGAGAGILFGREKWGLNNEEVALSDAIVTLPVEAAYASLNIAQAVLVLAYEWRRTATDAALPFAAGEEPPATREDIQGMTDHLVAALDRAGFMDASPDRRPTMLNVIRAMMAKTGYNAQEVRTFRGFLSALDRDRRAPDTRRTNKKGDA